METTPLLPNGGTTHQRTGDTESTSSTDKVRLSPSHNTKRVLDTASWNTVINVVGLAVFSSALVFALTQTAMFERGLKMQAHWNNDILFILQFLVLDTILLFMFLSPIDIRRLHHRPRARNFRKLYLCLVTKGENRKTVDRTVHEMVDLPSLDDRVRIVVLHEESSNFDHLRYFGVDLIQVPSKFQPRTALHKARSLEFFRRSMNFEEDDWILHLDEETIVDDHALFACIDFIEREVRYDYAQGLICYNTVNYWKNWLLTYVELVRFREDLGRFQFAHNLLHFPLNGYHGSFFLIRGALENQVTWETACLAEDFWFALQAWNQGYRGGFIRSLAREQNNYTFQDFFRQRRRWTCGVWSLGWMGKFNILVWNITNFTPIPGLLCSRGILHFPPWILVWGTVCLAYQWYSVAFATFLQDLDADIPVLLMLLHTLMIPLLTTLTTAMQVMALLFSAVRPVKPAQGFHVVFKE